MTTRQEDCAKAKRQTKDGGNKGGVAGVEATTQGRTGVTQSRDGSTTGADPAGGATRTD